MPKPAHCLPRCDEPVHARTVVVDLIPPNTVLANQAPYFLWPSGSFRDQAYVLGVLSSIPLDWYARRYVEWHLNFYVLYPLPVPSAAESDSLRRRVEVIGGVLAAVDERYAKWAAAVGVPCGGARGADEKADMIAELDAAVSLLYRLDEADVRHIFETFHVGWDYGARLDAVLAHYRRLKAAT